MKFRLLAVTLLGFFTGALSAQTPAQTPQLTSLRAIHALTNEQASAHLPVEFSATITYFRSYERTMFVQDGDVAIYVQANTCRKCFPVTAFSYAEPPAKVFAPLLWPRISR
jgi:hypothetical protein